MAEAPKTRIKVPDGKSRNLVTRQMKANDKGFIGYETIWDAPHKVIDYVTPKKP